MAGTCCAVVGETETSTLVEPSSRAAMRRRMEIPQFKFLATDVEVTPSENGRKRQKLEDFVPVASAAPECEKGNDNWVMSGKLAENGGSKTKSMNGWASWSSTVRIEPVVVHDCPKFGMTTHRGRRREMEDMPAICPSFCRRNSQTPEGLYFFPIYDGHGYPASNWIVGRSRGHV